jgi:hypothetical protein
MAVDRGSGSYGHPAVGTRPPRNEGPGVAGRASNCCRSNFSPSHGDSPSAMAAAKITVHASVENRPCPSMRMPCRVVHDSWQTRDRWQHSWQMRQASHELPDGFLVGGTRHSIPSLSPARVSRRTVHNAPCAVPSSHGLRAIPRPLPSIGNGPRSVDRVEVRYGGWHRRDLWGGVKRSHTIGGQQFATETEVARSVNRAQYKSRHARIAWRVLNGELRTWPASAKFLHQH